MSHTLDMPIMSIASFQSLSQERRIRIQMKERTTTTLMQMENAMSEDGERGAILAIVREILKSRGVLPNTLETP